MAHWYFPPTLPPPFHTHTHTHTHTHMHTLSLVAKYVCLWTYRLHLCSWMCTILNWNNNRVFQTKGITMLCWLVINELSPLRTSDFKITYVISCYLSAAYTIYISGRVIYTTPDSVTNNCLPLNHLFWVRYNTIFFTQGNSFTQAKNCRKIYTNWEICHCKVGALYQRECHPPSASFGEYNNLFYAAIS